MGFHVSLGECSKLRRVRIELSGVEGQSDPGI